MSRTAIQASPPSRPIEGMVWQHSETAEKKRWRTGRWVRFRRLKKPPWSNRELKVLRTVYVEQGLEAAATLLPGRARKSIYVQANRLGLKTRHRPARHGIYRKLAAQALELRKNGLSYRAIGEHLGMCAAAATNAVLAAECLAAGHRPLERGPDGRIAAAGRERIRLMLRKGLKHRDIQLRCGIAAATVTRERRLYEKELKERRMAPLPPPGGGERYSGARIPAAMKREVERLYLEGWGAGKISDRTGVSRSQVLRIREKLVARLKRKGECLPGCDRKGRRVKMRDHLRSIPEGTIEKLRGLLMEGCSVRSAAFECVVGLCRAYKEFHKLEAELAAAGKTMPRDNWRHGSKREKSRASAPLPGGSWAIDRYRALLRQMPPDEARAQVIGEYRARHASELEEIERRRRLEEARRRHEANRPKTFDEQIAALAAGKGRLVQKMVVRRPDPDGTLGGIATGMLA